VMIQIEQCLQDLAAENRSASRTAYRMNECVKARLE